MKKHFSILLITLAVIACNNTTERQPTGVTTIKTTAIDIDLKDLTTPCECVDALSLVIAEMIAITNDKPTSKTSMDDLLLKLNEVEDYCMDSKGFSKSEAEQCTGFDQLESSFDVVEDFIK